MSDDTIADRVDLRRHYREPSALAANKAVPLVDPASARFIAASPLVVMATSGARGTDASPRGGPPGFVRVVDGGQRVVFADLSGNNRLDSYTNVLDNAEVGLLFLVPGREETVRVNGRAHLSTDPDLCAATAIDGRPPKLVMVVEVRESFLHCGKALRRAEVWKPETWLTEPDAVPDAGEILAEQHDVGVGSDDINSALEADYQATLWRPGGEAGVGDSNDTQ